MMRSAPTETVYRRCVCGKAFQVAPDKETFCSVKCAREDALQSLQTGRSFYRQTEGGPHSQEHTSHSDQLTKIRGPQSKAESIPPNHEPQPSSTRLLSDSTDEVADYQLDIYYKTPRRQQERGTQNEDEVDLFVKLASELPRIMITPPSTTFSPVDILRTKQQVTRLETEGIRKSTRSSLFLDMDMGDSIKMEPQLVRFTPSPTTRAALKSMQQPHPVGRRTEFPPYAGVLPERTEDCSRG